MGSSLQVLRQGAGRNEGRRQGRQLESEGEAKQYYGGESTAVTEKEWSQSKRH